MKRGPMVYAHPNSGHLMRQVPVRRAKCAAVGAHAFRACLERMICSKSAGEDAQSELQGASRGVNERLDCVAGQAGPLKGQIERQDRSLMRQVVRITKDSPNSLAKIAQARGEVVLTTHTRRPK